MVDRGNRLCPTTGALYVDLVDTFVFLRCGGLIFGGQAWTQRDHLRSGRKKKKKKIPARDWKGPEIKDWAENSEEGNRI